MRAILLVLILAVVAIIALVATGLSMSGKSAAPGLPTSPRPATA